MYADLFWTDFMSCSYSVNLFLKSSVDCFQNNVYFNYVHNTDCGLLFCFLASYYSYRRSRFVTKARGVKELLLLSLSKGLWSTGKGFALHLGKHIYGLM